MWFVDLHLEYRQDQGFLHEPGKKWHYTLYILVPGKQGYSCKHGISLKTRNVCLQKGLDLEGNRSVCPPAPIHKSGTSSVSELWGSEYWSPSHLPGTHEIKDDFTEQRQKGRSLIKSGGAFTLACIFLVGLEWKIWGCRRSEAWLDTAHWWGNWQSVKEDSSTQC